VHSKIEKRDGFAPRAEPPTCTFQCSPPAFGTATLHRLPCEDDLLFADLITFVAADSDLTSLQKRKSSLKEVIQPHLPVRLPCYDFTPLTGHSFGASVPHGFGQRLREHQTRVM
jgi:hypothetical protein